MNIFRTLKSSQLLMLAYIFLSCCLVLYSYTQVDLNLTLSRASFVQTIQKAFQYIGYYNRPLSTALYTGILCAMFGLYAWAISLAKKGTLTLKVIWRIIIVTTCLVIFSYPAAFSYDFFNYMFTAKTIMVYHKNPYVVIPLQFAGIDPWTNFMRWTHLSSAYTPFWIALTLIPYVLGLGYFLTVMFGIKFLVAGFYLLSCYALVKVMEIVDKRSLPLSLVVFALNPLILIESLVSGHNDIVMMAFVLVALWYLHSKRVLASWWYLTLSVAAKFMTIVLIPIFYLKENRKLMLLAMVSGLGIVIFRRGEILPWYWVWIVPFVAMVPDMKELTIISAFFSFGLLTRYATFIYVGSYDPWVIQTNYWLPYAFLGAAIFWVIIKHKGRLRHMA